MPTASLGKEQSFASSLDGGDAAVVALLLGHTGVEKVVVGVCCVCCDFRAMSR